MKLVFKIVTIFLFIIIGVLTYIGYKSENIDIEQLNEKGNTVKFTTNNEGATELVKATINTVVGVSGEMPKKEWYFSSQVEEEWGVGTGIIVSSDGYILTNQHVSGKKGNKVLVTLSDGQNVEGVTMWADNGLDLAIIKIEVTNLPVAIFGNNQDLQVGQEVIAIGNPLGLEFQRSVTSGIISALNRTLSVKTASGVMTMEGLIQTDASINPGNSGGPLINEKGEVIGINTLKLSTAEGLGFAIPIDLAKPIIQKFINTNTFEPAYLGVYAYEKTVVPILYDGVNLDKGLYVDKVAGPAKEVGIKKGDIILSLNNEDVNTMLDLKTIIYKYNLGDTIKLNIISDNKLKSVDVVLGKKGYDKTNLR